jgi:hypothetical protein
MKAIKDGTIPTLRYGELLLAKVGQNVFSQALAEMTEPMSFFQLPPPFKPLDRTSNAKEILDLVEQQIEELLNRLEEEQEP